MVGIVILNFNNSAQTLGCLDTLYRHCKGDNYRICVVDNASRPEQAESLKAGLVHGEHLIVSPQNGGYARGNDLGCEYFDTIDEIDEILILNDDTRFTEDVVSPMQEYLDTHPRCGVVFPLVVAPDGRIDRACARRSKTWKDLALQATCLGKLGIRRNEFLPLEGLRDNDEVRTQVPPGSCMMLRKDVFRRLGWLDPGTFLYFEEHILSEKLKRENLECVLLPRIQIVHLGAQTTAQQKGNVIYRHWRQSYLYYLREYSGMPAALRSILRFRTWLRTLR